MTFIQGYSIDRDELAIPEKNVPEINFPKESEAYRKTVAQELRNIALSLGEEGIDYTPSVKQQVITELYKDIPEVVKTKSSKVNFTFESFVPVENFSSLTDEQLKLLNKILDEYKISRSDEVLFEKLKIVLNT